MLQQIHSQEDRPVHRVAVFLDIDGILHSTFASSELDCVPLRQARERRIDLVKGRIPPYTYGLLVDTKQELLANMLSKYPDVILVISSAWRNWTGYDDSKPGTEDVAWEHDNVDNLLWLKKLLHPVLAGRIVGKTPVIEGSGTTDLRPTRLDEIRLFMQDNAEPLGLSRSWVALDDQARHFPSDALACSDDAEELVVLVDGEHGLDSHSCARLEASIKKACCVQQPASVVEH